MTTTTQTHMRQAITTHFICPTNTRGSRIKASADAGSLITPWDYSIGVEENHRAGAEALVAKLGWSGEWIGGSVKGCGYVFVCLP